MAIIHNSQRSVPPYPDPRDTDQNRINRQIIALIKFLISKFNSSLVENRLAKLEKMVKNHDDIING